MCGIAGILNFRGDRPDPALLHRMADTIAHRGPDAEGIHVEPYIGLAQRRLSIIDLTDTANPPLSNEDGTIWIAFNGEIYNFLILRNELIQRGHEFKSRSDTEVLVHLYEEFGTDMLERLEGMFAFVIWDRRQRRIFAARDRIGKKPFIYTKTAKFLAFGSAIRAITAIPEISNEPDYGAIDSYLTHRYVPSPATAFKNIRKLRAGHALTCDANGRLNVFRYWSPPFGNKSRLTNLEDLRSELTQILTDCVRKRLLADVPIGALLSSGIDSGVVVAVMAQLTDKPVNTYTIGFGDPKRDELAGARLIAQRYGTKHNEIIVKPDVRDLLPELAYHYNEPFADSSAVPSYYVSKAARAEVTVALSGDGGDESFSGYNRYGEIQAWQSLDVIPSFIRSSVSRFGSAALGIAPRNHVAAKIDRGLAMVSGGLPQRYALAMTLLKSQEKQHWYSQRFAAELIESSSTDDREQENYWNVDELDALNWMAQHDQRNYLPDCLMVKMDVASMANSLEVRAPLLDHKLIEFAASIPGHLKRRGPVGKLLLKDIASDLLPTEILTRPKTGFDIPVANWLRFDLRDTLREFLLDDVSRRRGLFDQSVIASVVSQHLEGKRDWSNRLWALLMLEIWFREHID